jgi:hypothetical protein
MRRPYPFLAFHLLVVQAAGALIGLPSYKWLRLGQIAADVSRSWEGHWAGRLSFAPPPPLPDTVQAACLFESGWRLLHPDYDAAYRRAVAHYQSAPGRPERQQEMERAGTLEARGNHEGARRTLVDLASRTSDPALRAALLLRLGRVALAARQYGAAQSHPGQILNCCPAERDEHGLFFALGAAVQLAAGFEAQGSLDRQFHKLASGLDASRNG